MQELTVTVNGRQHRAEVDERTLLLHFLRDELGLTGTHNGCLEARCGCCAVLVNGQSSVPTQGGAAQLSLRRRPANPPTLQFDHRNMWNSRNR